MREFLVVLLFLPAFFLHSQTNVTALTAEEEHKKDRFVGINVSPLVSNLIPFNNAQGILQGGHSIQYLSIKPETNRMNRILMGFRLRELGNNSSDEFIALRFTTSKRVNLHKNWTAFRGFDIHVGAGDLKQPFETDFNEGFLGIGPHYGIEFHPLPRLSFSTEAYAFFGLGSESGIVFNVVPPLSFFMNIKFK